MSQISIYNNKTEKHLSYLFLLVIAIIGYWQIAFMQFPLKYDMIDGFYPWRYFIGECLKNHIMPLWNPYQGLGYPIHADPQSGVWYPFVWIIGFLYGYDIYSISFEFMLHIFLSGVGMYILAKTLKFENKVALFMGISYMFSGFFIGNAQHLTYIISGTWIPFIISSYIMIYKEKPVFNAVKTSFFIFMLIAGGYPAISFLTGYFLVFLFLFYLIKFIKNKNYKKLIFYLKINLLILTVTILLTSVILISIYNVLPYLTRANSLILDKALFDPLSPQCLISLILPFAVIRDMPFYDTDLSMSNVYFGLIPFIFFIVSLFIKKPKLIIIFLIYGLFALTASMGKYLPVREFLYNYVPFMNLFRFPSIFRLFVIICFIVVSGYGLDYFIKNKNKSFNPVKITAFIFLIIFFLLLVYSRYVGYLDIRNFINNELFIFSQNSFIRQHIAFQSIIQIIFLSIFIFLIFKIKERNKLFRYLILLLIFDTILSAQLNGPYTVYYDNFKSKKVKKYSDNIFPKGFPLPSNKNIIEISDTGLGYGPLWRNLNIFNKQIACDGYNPFYFKNCAYLESSMPLLFKTTLSNYPVFLSDKIFISDSIKTHYIEHKFNSKYIYLNKIDFFKIKKINLKWKDTFITDTVYITEFSPNKTVVKVRSSKNQLLTLLQNNYYGWKAFVNGKRTSILTSNLSFISVLVPYGKSDVAFVYNPKSVLIGFYISLISLITVFLILAIIPIKEKNKI